MSTGGRDGRPGRRRRREAPGGPADRPPAAGGQTAWHHPGPHPGGPPLPGQGPEPPQPRPGPAPRPQAFRPAGHPPGPGGPFPGPAEQVPPGRPGFPPGPARPAVRSTGRMRNTAGRWFTDRQAAEAPGAPPSGPFPPPVPPQGPEPMGPPAGGPAEPPAPPRPGRTKRRRSPFSFSLPALRERGLSDRQQTVLVAVAGGVVVLAIAIALTVVVGRLSKVAEPPRAAAGESSRVDLARPDDYQGWTSLPQFKPIADRRNDPKPVTAKEIFATRTLKGDRITLRLVARKEDGDCSAVVWGEQLAAKLAAGGCNQAVRGLYRSADGRYVAQYTLLNLATVAAADDLVKELTTMHRGGWVRPLESAAATFAPGGYTEASGHAMGHLVGLVWLGRADGREPTARDDFVGLSLTVRAVEKAVFKRVVAAGGKPEASPK